VAKNKWRVTSRRARKQFMLKFIPNAHWSAAFYILCNTKVDLDMMEKEPTMKPTFMNTADT